jgi:hypothetical protein
MIYMNIIYSLWDVLCISHTKTVISFNLQMVFALVHVYIYEYLLNNTEESMQYKWKEKHDYGSLRIVNITSFAVIRRPGEAGTTEPLPVVLPIKRSLCLRCTHCKITSWRSRCAA